MTVEEIYEMFENDDIFSNPKVEGDRALLGLQILSKYSDYVLHGADHDIIYSIDVGEVEGKISKEEVQELIDLGWMIQDEYFAKFV